MKNIFLVIHILAILLVFCSCEAQSQEPYDFKANDYVDLYDYKSISVDKNYIKISQEDIDTIINLDFSSRNFYYQDNNSDIINEDDTVLIDIECSDDKFQINDWYYEIGSGEITEEFDSLLIGKPPCSKFEYTYVSDKEYKFNVTLKGIFILNDPTNEDAVCSFYSLPSVNEVYKYLTERAQKEILYNYAMEQILTQSKLISFPKSIIKKANTDIEKTFDSIDTTSNIEEIQQNIYNYYYEIIILKAILENEKIEVNFSDIDKKIINISEKNSVNVEIIKDLYSTDDIYFLTMTDILKPILVNYIFLTD